MSTGPELFVICKNCGSEVSPYITECPYCGGRLRKRAPRLDRAGRERRRRMTASSLGRLRSGEIPGIRGDPRPYASGALIVASVLATIAWHVNIVDFDRLAVVGKPAGEWWRTLSASLVYVNLGYLVVALTAVALFGGLLERRHGPLPTLMIFAGCGAAGMAVAAVLERFPYAAGGNAAALGLLAAWALPHLAALRRNRTVEWDGLGVLAFAAVLLLMPVVTDEADVVAGVAGGAAGLLIGAPLARLGAGE